MIDSIDGTKYIDKREVCELLELTYTYYNNESTINRMMITIAEIYEFRTIKVNRKNLYLKEDILNFVEKVKEFYNMHYPSDIASEIYPGLRHSNFQKIPIPKGYNLIIRSITKSKPGTKIVYKKDEIDNALFIESKILEKIKSGELIKKKEAEEFLGISEVPFNRYRKELNLEETLFKNTIYFNKSDLIGIKANIKKPISKKKADIVTNEELENYISKDEACKMLEITSEHYSKDGIKSTLRNVVIGFNIKYTTRGSRNFYLKEDIEKAVLEVRRFFDQHYSVEEAKSIRPNLYTLDIEKVRVPSHYRAILRSSISFSRGMNTAYRKKDIDDYNRKLLDTDENIKNGSYISIEDACNILNLSRRMFNINRKEYSLNEIKYNNALYFKKEEIELLLKQQETFYKTYIDKKGVREKYMSESAYYQYGRSLKIYKAPLIAYTKEKIATLSSSNGECHKISDISDLVKNLDNIKKENKQKAWEEGKGIEYINYDIEGETYFDTFKLRLYDNWDGFNNASIYTEEKWFKFVSDKIETMRASKKVTLNRVNNYIRCTKTLKRMLVYFDVNEVYQLTTNQINTYFNIIKTSMVKETLYEFLRIVSGDLKIILKGKRKGFKIEQVYSPYANYNEKKEDELYDFEEYQEVFNYLIDKDMHIKESIFEIKNKNTVKYVSTWLYAMLHLNNAWRHGDVTRFPAIKIDDLLDVYKIDSFEWFLNNDITIDKARAIISRIIQGDIIISKTQITGTFFCSDELAPSIATSIAILSLYHKENPKYAYNDSIMVLGTQYNDVYENHLKELFKNLNNKNFKFSSRKMNKTVMTYIYYLANLSGDSKSLLYAKKIREHISKESTLHYINMDFKHIDTLSKQLFMRGEFGYISNMLISRVYGNDTNTLENTTEKIMRLNYIFGDVFKVYSTVGFLNSIRSERELVLATLAEKSLKECQEILTDLFAQKMPSREINVQCLMSKEGCQHPNLKTCFECQYHIPSIYALTTLCKSLMEDIKQYPLSSKIKQFKLSLSIDRKIILLQEAIETFGKEYVYNCLNIEAEELEGLLIDIKLPNEYIGEF